jgi:hypothetical protein
MARGDFEPMTGFFAVQVVTLAAAAEEWDAPVVTGVMPTGEWR